MGKYMRKAKGVKGEVAVMEVQSPLGVRTRAKTHALQRLEAASAAAAAAAEDGDGSYLQLRSRRLQKPAVPSPVENERRKKKQKKKGNLGTSGIGKEEGEEENGENEKKVENEEEGINGNGVGDERVEQEQEKEDEGCFGENVLEIEGRGRSTRESTPCNLITDPDNIKTPGSSTKRSRASEAGSRVRNSMQRDLPTAQEMDEFFAAAEEQQRKQFMDKYNFDPVNDKPLRGRFEWVKLDP